MSTLTSTPRSAFARGASLRSGPEYWSFIDARLSLTPSKRCAAAAPSAPVPTARSAAARTASLPILLTPFQASLGPELRPCRKPVQVRPCRRYQLAHGAFQERPAAEAEAQGPQPAGLHDVRRQRRRRIRQRAARAGKLLHDRRHVAGGDGEVRAVEG